MKISSLVLCFGCACTGLYTGVYTKGFHCYVSFIIGVFLVNLVYIIRQYEKDSCRRKRLEDLSNNSEVD